MPAHEIVKTGISQVPEGRRIFAEMSVMENLDMGAFIRKDKDGVRQDLKMVFERFPRLEERKDQIAGTLSGGGASDAHDGTRPYEPATPVAAG